MAKARKTTTKKTATKVAGAKKVAGTKRKVTAYQRVQKAVAANCKAGTAATKEKLSKAIENYVSDAVSKGKSAAEARKSANRANTCNPFKKKK